MSETSFRLGVVMERRALADRWQTIQWMPIGIALDAGAPEPPQLLYKDAACERWLHSGFEVRLYNDEAQGYFLNCSAAEPVLFVSWRMEDDMAVPWCVTASYNEAARMLDSNESVEGVRMPHEVFREVSAYVTQHYKPEPKKRSKPPSFKGAHRDE
jgi:Protein of unknown function (DUF3305).